MIRALLFLSPLQFKKYLFVDERYIVLIPFVYRDKLLERFNYENNFLGIIDKVCSLCVSYKKACCFGCPFYRIGTIKSRTGFTGCIDWLNFIFFNEKIYFNIGSSQIFWSFKDDNKVKQQFEILKVMSERYIKWI